MHHFRGKLLEGTTTRLDPANVYIQYRTTDEDQSQGWYGYLQLAAESDVVSGQTYTLTLMDGRTGVLQVESVSLDESGKVRASFFGEGPLK